MGMAFSYVELGILFLRGPWSNLVCFRGFAILGGGAKITRKWLALTGAKDNLVVHFLVERDPYPLDLFSCK